MNPVTLLLDLKGHLCPNCQFESLVGGPPCSVMVHPSVASGQCRARAEGDLSNEE